MKKRAGIRINVSLVTGLVISLAILFAAVAAPLIATHGVEQMDMRNRFAGPSLGHWLGTDNFGRDLWTRLIFGARVSLTIALIPVFVAATFGTLVGIIAGYFGGWTDLLLMRLADVFLGFPALILVLAIVAVLGPGILNVSLALVVVFWTDYARVVRSSTLVLREQAYVLAARAVGASHFRILFKEILPNAWGPVLVLATLGLGNAILTESALSFLGFGVPPPQPTWGWTLAYGTRFMRGEPWLAIISGLAIMVTVLGFNLLGDGLRDLLDPKGLSRGPSPAPFPKANSIKGHTTMNTFTIRRAKFSNHADGSDAALTFHDIVGQAPGPTIGISGAIHGNEPTGTEIILELYRALQTIPVHGHIVLLPVANPRAYAQNRRFTTIDELNLNREFPGDPNGSYTQQLPTEITREFLEQINVHIDMHSGTDRPTVDYVYMRNDEALSRSFGSRVLYRPQATKEGTTFNGTTTTVTIDRRNIPSVVVELGGGIIDQCPYVERGLKGLLNMLRHLRVIDGTPTPPPKQIVVGAIKTIRPTRAGLLETLAPPLGEVIKKGQLLGRVVSPYTFEVLEEIPAPFDEGVMILSHLSRNLVESGDYGYMVGDMDGAGS